MVFEFPVDQHMIGIRVSRRSTHADAVRALLDKPTPRRLTKSTERNKNAPVGEKIYIANNSLVLSWIVVIDQ